MLETFSVQKRLELWTKPAQNNLHHMFPHLLMYST